MQPESDAVTLFVVSLCVRFTQHFYCDANSLFQFLKKLQTETDEN